MPRSQRIVTLPPAMVTRFASLEERPAPEWFATGDPDAPLGSGGGTAHALLDAWRASGTPDFDAWLAGGRRMVVHAGGQSRRLPAFAAVGKALIPIPVPRGSVGGRPDGALIDLQVGLFDALILPTRLPDARPEADVVMLGMRTDPVAASHHGVFFLRHDRPHTLDRFLQKLAPETTAALATTHGDNVVTNVPPNDWRVALARGVCLDLAPVEGGSVFAPTATTTRSGTPWTIRRPSSSASRWPIGSPYVA